MAALEDWSASFLISEATTAKPFPASPALAASMEAFKERSTVCSAMLSIVVTILLIDFDFFAKSKIESVISFVISVVSCSFSPSASTIPLPSTTLFCVPVAIAPMALEFSYTLEIFQRVVAY